MHNVLFPANTAEIVEAIFARDAAFYDRCVTGMGR
jgi:hypothetical protein